MRFGSESGVFKKLCWWALAGFAVYCAMRDPNGTGTAVHNLGVAVAWAANGIDTIINKI